jgi:NTE family protein
MAFETLRQRNELAAMAAHMQAAGVADLPRVSKPVRMPLVIAPQELMPLEWIVDYETANHERLFALGRADAERALRERA